MRKTGYPVRHYAHSAAATRLQTHPIPILYAFRIVQYTRKNRRRGLICAKRRFSCANSTAPRQTISLSAPQPHSDKKRDAKKAPPPEKLRYCIYLFHLYICGDGRTGSASTLRAFFAEPAYFCRRTKSFLLRTHSACTFGEPPLPMPRQKRSGGRIRQFIVSDRRPTFIRQPVGMYRNNNLVFR